MANSRSRQNIDGAAEAQDLHRHARLLQKRLTGRIAAQGAGPGQARPVQRLNEVDEVGLRPALAGRSQKVQNAHCNVKPSRCRSVSQALEARRLRPYKPASRERTYGWVAQLVRAVDS